MEITVTQFKATCLGVIDKVQKEKLRESGVRVGSSLNPKARFNEHDYQELLAAAVDCEVLLSARSGPLKSPHLTAGPSPQLLRFGRQKFADAGMRASQERFLKGVAYSPM